MVKHQPDERAIFNIARRLKTPEDRRIYLEQVCGDDRELQKRIAELLRGFEEGEGFLEPSPVGVAATLDVNHSTDGGATVGPYRLREQIGEGGMGVVYVAEQSEPVRRKVALKIVKPGLESKEVVARFEAERQALAMMDHPNIARVFDGGATEAGQPYFVMELVQGPPINEYCDLQRATVRARLELFLKVCRAVHHAHQKGIIHRDLKPSNVLVPEIDGAAVPKVIDFGVAKAVDQKLTEQTVYTQFAQLVGTPLYMSPEQAGMGVLDIDTRSDVYSLGVLLYELLTGRTPFESERLKQAGYDEMRRIIREERPRLPSAMVSTLQAADRSTVAECRGIDLRKLPNTLRGELDWLVMKALEKDRDRRYESAAALADDIGRYLGDLPVVARPPSTAYRFRKFVRRNRALVGSLSMVFVALTLGIVLATVGFLNARSQLADTKALADLLRTLIPGPDWRANTLGQHHTVYKSIEKVSPTLDQRLGDHPAVEIEVRRIFGRAYTAAGEFDKARTQFNLALQVAEREYGQEHEIVAAIHAQLADEVGWNQSPLLDYPTLLAHAEKAIEIYEAQGQEASELAWFAKAFCLLYWPERWAEAEAAQRKCVELSKRDGSEGRVIPLCDLGWLLVRLGDDRLDDAKFELEKAVTVAQLQSNPLLQATAIEGLGRCQRQQGEIEDAIESFQRAWELYQSDVDLMPDPRRYAAGFQLAESHFAAGNVDLAFELANEIEQQSQDGGTPELQAEALFFKGWLCFQLKNYELAAAWFEQSMDQAAKHFGSQHRKFAYACGYLALSLEASDRRKEAALLFERVLPFTAAGADSPFSSAEMYWRHCMALLGTIGDNASHLETALTVAQKGQDHVGLRSWTWQEPAFHLLDAEIHRCRDQPQAAIKELQKGLEKAKEPHATFRASRYDVPTMRSELELMLANLLLQEDRQDEAREVLNEAVQKRAAHLETEHIQVALAQLQLGELLIAQSDFSAAEEPLLQAHKKLLRHSDVVNPLRWRAATKLVELYQMMDQPQEAAEWQAKLDTLNLKSEVNAKG